MGSCDSAAEMAREWLVCSRRTQVRSPDPATPTAATGPMAAQMTRSGLVQERYSSVDVSAKVTAWGLECDIQRVPRAMLQSCPSWASSRAQDSSVGALGDSTDTSANACKWYRCRRYPRIRRRHTSSSISCSTNTETCDHTRTYPTSLRSSGRLAGDHRFWRASQVY